MLCGAALDDDKFREIRSSMPRCSWRYPRSSIGGQEEHFPSGRCGEAFIEYKEGHPFRKMNEEFCRLAGISRDVVCEVDEPAALGSLVAAGLGAAFVPGCKGDEEPPYAMVRIEKPSCYRTFTLAWLERDICPRPQENSSHSW